MATTLSSIVDRAVAWSVANGGASLVSDLPEVINRIAADERSMFDVAAETNSSYYAVTQAVTSSAGSSARTISTSGLAAGPVGRILRFVLASGTEVNQVDLRDTDAELAPRFYMLGTTLVEVSNDWSATSGAVAGTLTYVKRPTVLSTTGALSQTITLDDQFSDILEMRLAWYLAHKDVGRETPEMDRLSQMIAGRMRDFVTFLGQFGGVEVRRFVLPTTTGKR